MNSKLRGVTVLVTRPAHQAEYFCQLVETAGGQVIRFPVIEIQPLAFDGAARATVQKPSDYLIFISVNAARLGVETISNLAADHISQSRVAAIGEATAHELERLGVKLDLVPPSPYNSEALLAMPEMQNVTGQHFTIIKGRGGRDYLIEQLRVRGAKVNEIDVYTRAKPRQNNVALRVLSECSCVIASITSVKGLYYLFEMASPEQGNWLRQHARFLVPGHRVADAVRDLRTRHRPVIAENATDTAMFARLIDNTEE